MTELEFKLSVGSISDIDIFACFNNKDLIRKTIYEANVGGKFESWKRAALLIDAFLKEENTSVNNIDNWIEFINIGVFYPSYLDNISLDLIVYYLNILDLFYLNAFLCHKQNIVRLKKIITEEANLIQLNQLVFLQFLLSSCKDNLLPSDEEAALIRRYLEKEDITDIFHEVLSKRLDSLKNRSTKQSTVPKSIKILITGQLRGWHKSFPTLLKKIENTKGVSSLSISTWDQIGVPRFIPQLYHRIFEYDAISLFTTNKSHHLVQKVTLALQDTDLVKDGFFKKYLMQRNLKDSWNDIDINTYVISQKDYPFSIMSNAEKMYFHNTFVSSKCLKEDDDCVVLKLRPDTLFKTEEGFNILNMDFCNTIYTESGYRFASWGFGMGDQIIFGLSTNLKSILNSHMRKSLSYKIVKNMYKHDSGYQGHVNCGLEAWLQGVKVKVLPREFSQIGLSSTKMITKKQLMDWI